MPGALGGRAVPVSWRAFGPAALGIGAAVLVLGGCGSAATPPQASAPSATASPAQNAGSGSAREDAGVVAVLDRPFGSVPNTARLFGIDGTELASTAVDDSVEAVGLAGHRLLLAGSGRVRALDTRGALSVVTAYDAAPEDLVQGIIGSPDGSAWLWSVLHRQADGTVLSRVLLGGDGRPAVEVLRRSSSGRALAAVRWSPLGPVLSDEDIGIGGYILFRRVFGEALLLDPAAHAVTSLAPASCALSDVTATGASACVSDGREGPHGNDPVTLHVHRPGRADLVIALPADVHQAGAAFFSPDGRTLSLASSPADATDSERITTELVDVDSGARRVVAGTGLIPLGWTARGVLVAERIPGSAGGPVGTYAVAAGGAITPITTAGDSVGVSG